MKPVSLVRALRPHQWVKNVFVLAALVFAGGERGALLSGDRWDLYRTLFAFAAFCLGSSAIYLVNDVMDVESDRLHPTKKKRPIAAGEVRVPTALGASVLCVLGALLLGHEAGGSSVPVMWIVAAYMALNLAYSLKLKHVVIVDAFCIAAGFILRVLAGGQAANAVISHWLVLCTLFLALFLALCKRRAETDLLGENRGGHRSILLEYNTAFLDQMVTVLAACTIVTYTMYTVAEETVHKFGSGYRLMWTVPFVVFGLARYMLLVHTQKGGGSPTKVLLGGDLLFFLNGLGWVATVVWAVYSHGA
ncbi:MAG: decaprenyl-phosphate phosphoribosyltransferase [Planctomycetes bacterium]|nr:decaprenyl-phosphate phosphoribosyltransferase [Planctomycetota bacterium]